MTRSGWTARMVLGVGLGIAVGSSPGCYFNEDNFAEDFADEICRMVRDCGRTLTLPGAEQPLSATASCEAEVVSHYRVCGDLCDYRSGKARRCLRRLRNNECHSDDVNDGDEWIPLICSEVYSECGSDPEADETCAAPGCSVSTDPPSDLGWALGGLLALFVGRRRRRLGG